MHPTASKPDGPVKSISLVILGVGGVGRSLARQVLAHRDLHHRDYGIEFVFRSLADSGASLVIPAGTSDALIEELIDFKESGGRYADRSDYRSAPSNFLRAVQDSGSGLIADCTAVDTTSLLSAAVRAGWGVALANKRPLTGDPVHFKTLAGELASQRPAGWEATVGAGLPVTTALRRLMAAGDRIRVLRGSVSSTLGYLMAGLARGEDFSRLVQAVRREGYTEPDPREDLSGRDVARKALILARTLGMRLQLPDIRVEGLLPASLETLSLKDFRRRLPELDRPWRERVEVAHARGKTLRYGFRLDQDGASVGLIDADQDSALGRLTGTNQVVEIYSSLYRETPLVVQGRGAGVAATAAGVLSDLVELAGRLFRP